MSIQVQLSDILTPKGRFDCCKRVFSPKSFGTLHELRAEFQHAYPAARLLIPIDSLGTIDSLLILPHKDHTSETDSEQRVAEFQKSVHDSKLFAQNLSKQTDADLADKMNRSKNEVQGKPFVIFCLPNAGLYELMILSDQTMIDTFQKKGYCVLIWNYRGYGHSTGLPSMENLATDGGQLLRLVRHGLGASKVVVYGRSLGGHVAKAMSDDVDLVMIDRSFSSISLVPRIVIGQRWVQYAYDLMIDNYQVNIRKIMDNNTHKILLVDPCVDSFQ